jgi:hypothetical protein
MTPSGSHRIRSQNETFGLKAGLFRTKEICERGDVFLGHDKPKAQVLTLGKENVADLKSSVESVFNVLHGVRMQWFATGVNLRIQKEKKRLSGGMAKGKKIKKDVLQVETLNGVGHGMSEGGKRKTGRPEKSVSSEQKKIALRAAYLGMPEDRVAVLCGFSCGNPAGWGQYLIRHPEFKRELETARVTGEVEMQGRVLDAGNGWQGSAWLLERTRGYVARASLEHTGKGGKELSVSGNLLGAFGGQSK